MYCFSRPLPSLESPQLEFLTPTEDIAVPVKQEEIQLKQQTEEKTSDIPPVIVVKKPVDLPVSFKEKPEPTQQPEYPESTQSTQVVIEEEANKLQLSDQIKKEQQPTEEFSDPKQQTVASSEVLDGSSEPELRKSIEKLPEATGYEKQDPIKKTALLEAEATLIIELLEEKTVQGQLEGPFDLLAEDSAVTETVQHPGEELPGSG